MNYFTWANKLLKYINHFEEKRFYNFVVHFLRLKHLKSKFTKIQISYIFFSTWACSERVYNFKNSFVLEFRGYSLIVNLKI